MIKEMIVKLYHKVSGLAITHMAVCVYNHGAPHRNLEAYLRLKKTDEALAREHFDRIGVVFVCQGIQVWSKVRPVYERMRKDDRFRLWIIAVPDITAVDGENEAYEFLTGLGYEDVIEAKTEEGWFDIQFLHPYYVFLPKPYEQYMPREYQSRVISSYAKICYILYGLETTKIIVPFTYSMRFFRNVSVYFAENSYYMQKNKKRMAVSHKKRIRRSLNLGYPAFETVSRLPIEQHSLPLRVLWTPRWSEDKEVGGSNFLKFKDALPDFIEAESDLSMMFRPHPLTFYHFISEKKLTEGEVSAYKARYEESASLWLDETPEYFDAFAWSDVLVSDTSSLVIEYAVMKKPLIFCDTGCKNSPDMDVLMEGFYVAHSLEEVKRYLKMLAEGKDPKKEKREAICREMFGKDISRASARITEALAKIYEDSRKKDGSCAEH